MHERASAQTSSNSRSPQAGAAAPQQRLTRVVRQDGAAGGVCERAVQAPRAHAGRLPARGRGHPGVRPHALQGDALLRVQGEHAGDEVLRLGAHPRRRLVHACGAGGGRRAAEVWGSAVEAVRHEHCSIVCT